MYRSGHIGLSLLLYSPILIFVGSLLDWLLPVALIGAFLLMDPFLVLVAARQFIYNKIIFHLSRLSFSLSTIQDYDRFLPGIKHRGLTHTVWFSIVMGAGTSVGGLSLGLAIGSPLFPEHGARVVIATLLCGYIGFHAGIVHILGDVLTPTGIQPFAPISNRHYTANLVRADSTIANASLFIFGTGSFLISVPLAITI